MERKEFEFVKAYPQGGHKVGDKIKFVSMPHHLRDYLKEVGGDPEGNIKPKPSEAEKREKISESKADEFIPKEVED